MLQIPASTLQSQDQAKRRARRLRRAGLALGAIVLLLAAAGGIFWMASPSHRAAKPVRVQLGTRPPPLPALKEGFLPLSPAKAEEINAEIPISVAPIELSRPFSLPAVTAENFAAHQSALDCLTAAVYYEAASEDLTGQRAVAQVVLNRMRHPAFPKSVCGVVYEGAQRTTGCQFSFTCDGSLARVPSRTGWDRARGVAAAALAGYVEPSVGTSTHYHAAYVVPYWAWSLDKVAVIGAHIFYRWKGFWGRRSAFNGIYAGETAGAEQSPLIPLFNENDDGTAETSGAPLRTRLLADDLGRIASAPAPEAATGPTLRADQESGTLAVDDKAGALIQSEPNPAGTAN